MRERGLSTAAPLLTYNLPASLGLRR
jgi:hypothetical protein